MIIILRECGSLSLNLFQVKQNIMKILKLIIYILFAAVFSIGCKKESEVVTTTTQNEMDAKLKVIYASAYVIRDSIQIKINDIRVSNTFLGISSSNTAPVPTPFPGGGLNTGGDNRPFYLSITPGDTKIFVSVPKKLTSIDSIIRFSGQANLEARKHYSAYITDTLLNARMVLVEDNLADVDPGISRFKFVNLIPNLVAIDVYFGTNMVANNVAYKAVSPEFTLPNAAAGQWRIRSAGALSTSTPIAVYPGTVVLPTFFTVPNQRVMTVFAKGYSGGTIARIPTVSLLYNK